LYGVHGQKTDKVLGALFVVLGLHDLVIDNEDFSFAVLTLSPRHEDGFQLASDSAFHTAVGTLTVDFRHASIIVSGMFSEDVVLGGL